ncbi:MAG: hypothetical protein M1840_006157 [Geoglossum simile]|nr:MAG: hypothetical protein M1840_006157 [Geoglossum simile]
MKTALILSLLASLTVAVPMGKRHIKWVTQTDYTTVTIDVTTTIYVNPTGGPTAPSPPVVPSIPTSNPPAQFYAPPSVPAPSPGPTSTKPTTTPELEPTVTPEAHPYVPPPSPEAPSPVTPSPSPSKPSPTPPAPTSPNSGGDGGPCSAGSPCSGDMTFYDAGLGSCGDTNNGDVEDVVALAHGMMGLQSNGNPLCGKTITVSYGGKTITAVVKDKCMGCVGNDIDLSRHAFNQLAEEGAGRVTAKWWYN